MPRNGSGGYSLPQSPFVAATTISSAAVNSDLSDIATALTGSVSADGQTSISGVLKSSISGGPAYSSTLDATTGFGVSVSGEADVYAGGTKVIAVTNTGATVSGNETVTGNLAVTGNLSVTGTQAFTGTGAITLPNGTTGQRPTPAQAMIRYSSTNSGFEGYDGTEWLPMSYFSSAYTISASSNGTLLTVNVLNALTAAAPTAADPLRFSFRDTTLTAGDPINVTASSALTMTTNAAGATLGTQNNVPFRLWILLFNNAGTPVLALWHSGAGAATVAVNSLNEGTLQSTTGISAAATSAGVFYTPNGTTLASKAFKILGYLEYTSGLGTAGTYATAPNILQLFGPGIKKPGDVVQSVWASSTGTATANSSTKVQATPTVAIAPSSTSNLVRVKASGLLESDSISLAAQAFLSRGTSFTALTIAGTAVVEVGSQPSGGTVPLDGIDAPGTTSSTTYVPFINCAGTATAKWNPTTNSGTPTAFIEAQEIMG